MRSTRAVREHGWRSPVCSSAQQFAEQRQSIAKAIELDPTPAAARWRWAIRICSTSRVISAQAEKFFRQTISLNPGESNYWWSLGDVYRATNRLEEARDYYKRATLLIRTMASRN